MSSTTACGAVYRSARPTGCCWIYKGQFHNTENLTLCRLDQTQPYMLLGFDLCYSSWSLWYGKDELMDLLQNLWLTWGKSTLCTLGERQQGGRPNKSGERVLSSNFSPSSSSLAASEFLHHTAKQYLHRSCSSLCSFAIRYFFPTVFQRRDHQVQWIPWVGQDLLLQFPSTSFSLPFSSRIQGHIFPCQVSDCSDV